MKNKTTYTWQVDEINSDRILLRSATFTTIKQPSPKKKFFVTYKTIDATSFLASAPPGDHTISCKYNMPSESASARTQTCTQPDPNVSMHHERSKSTRVHMTWLTSLQNNNGSE